MVDIGIVDYGINNLFSVRGAVEKAGGTAIVTNNHADLSKVSKLLLPGVGAFGRGMKNLRQAGLVELLDELVINRQVPILGICLGAHLMLEASSESPGISGLGWIKGKVLPLQTVTGNGQAQHVGWNEVIQKRDIGLWKDIPNNADFYFIHGFHMVPSGKDMVAAKFSFGREYCAAISKDNIYLTQFHPEKSQLFGLRLIKNFVEL